MNGSMGSYIAGLTDTWAGLWDGGWMGGLLFEWKDPRVDV